MSWQKSLLNPLLRLIEKRQMANAKGPSSLRRAFELKAKILFHALRGTELEWFDLGDTSALRIGAEGLDAEKVILYCHGGGHVFGSPKTHSAMVAKRVGCEAILQVYPLSPENVFPASLNTLRTAYDDLLAQGFAAHRLLSAVIVRAVIWCWRCWRSCCKMQLMCPLAFLRFRL